jgi:hypothetical protein
MASRCASQAPPGTLQWMATSPSRIDALGCGECMQRPPLPCPVYGHIGTSGNRTVTVCHPVATLAGAAGSHDLLACPWNACFPVPCNAIAVDEWRVLSRLACAFTYASSHTWFLDELTLTLQSGLASAAHTASSDSKEWWIGQADVWVPSQCTGMACMQGPRPRQGTWLPGNPVCRMLTTAASLRCCLRTPRRAAPA